MAGRWSVRKPGKRVEPERTVPDKASGPQGPEVGDSGCRCSRRAGTAARGKIPALKSDSSSPAATARPPAVRTGRSGPAEIRATHRGAGYSPLMRSLVLDYLDGVYRELSGDRSGSVADYIPELAVVDPDSFGICLATSDGYVYEAGDSRKRFAIQSVSKPFTYALALADRGSGGGRGEDRRRAVRGAVQRDQPRPGQRAAAQPDDQRRCDHRRVAGGRRHRRRAFRTAARVLLTLRRPRPAGRPGHVRLRGPDREPEPGHRLHAAQLRHSGGGPADHAVGVLPAVLHRGGLPRPEPDGGDPGGQRCPSGHRRPGADPGADRTGAQRDDHLRHVQRGRRLGHRGRAAGEKRCGRRDSGGAARSDRAGRVLPAAGRARQQCARRAGVPAAVP